MSDNRFHKWYPDRRRAKDAPDPQLLQYLYAGVNKGMAKAMDGFHGIARNIGYNAINELIVLLSKDVHAVEALQVMVERAREHNKKG